MVFFVLSGYLIAGSVRRSVQRGEWDWRGYAMQRLTRLWVVLLPGLLICAACDWVGMRSGWAPRLYAGLSGDHLVANVVRDYNWSAFGRTALFLQGITGRVFGSDGPLWSVGYEAWYYVMFPLGLFAVMLRGWARAVLLAALLAVAAAQGREMLALFPVWLAGAALTLLPRSKAGAPLRRVAGAFYLPVFLAAGRFGRVGAAPASRLSLLTDYGVGLATVGLIWLLLSARQVQTGATWERMGRGLARFSYTLYVVHVPLLVLLAAWAGRDRRWLPDAVHLAAATGLLVVVLGVAWVVAWATEFRTGWVRSWIASIASTQRK